MAEELVRARFNGVETNVGKTFAEMTDGVEVLDEPTRDRAGRLRPVTRVGGRPPKKRTTVTKAAAEKKAVTESATTEKENDQ